MISTSCTVLDQILDYIFERSVRPELTTLSIAREPEGDKWQLALEKEPDILYDASVLDVSKNNMYFLALEFNFDTTTF